MWTKKMLGLRVKPIRGIGPNLAAWAISGPPVGFGKPIQRWVGLDGSI